jgi:hypothetical protein
MSTRLPRLERESMQVQHPRGREFRLWRMLSALKRSRIRSTLPM